MKTETNRTRPGDKGSYGLEIHWQRNANPKRQLGRVSGPIHLQGSSLKSEGSKAQSQQGCMAQERKDGARKETSGNALGVVMLSCWQRISQGFLLGQRIMVLVSGSFVTTVRGNLGRNCCSAMDGELEHFSL
jgi:hypothetical protein